MSIFYKFGIVAGNVECPGAMDMSVADLKLAIVQQRKIKNVTDYDLQIENSQGGKPYIVEEELIPRGTTVTVRNFSSINYDVLCNLVKVRRVPMPKIKKEKDVTNNEWCTFKVQYI